MDFLDNINGRDGYLIGTMQAVKNTGKLNVYVKEKQYKFYTLISVLFTSIMIISNILSTKLVDVCGFTIAGAMLVYPFSYIDRKSTRLNSSHSDRSRMPSSA